MRIYFKSLTVEISRDATMEAITVELSPGFHVLSAYNEYGVAVRLTDREKEKIKRRVLSRLLE